MPKKPTAAPVETEDPILVSAAKVIGAAAGKIASLAGAAPPATPKTPKVGKLLKKSGSRLPRKQKKAQQKKMASQ